MAFAELAKTIDSAFDRREELGPASKGAVREAVEQRSIFSIAAQPALPSGPAMAAGASTNGSKRQCCCRFVLTI